MREGKRFWIGVERAVSLLRDSFRNFRSNDPLRLAAATSFFASFALPPILLILTEALGLFADPRTIRHGLFEQLGRALDQNVALQARQVLRNLHLLSISPGVRFGGFVFLLFVATTLFEVIRNTLNQIWKIRLREPLGFGLLMVDRLRSLAIILITGLLFSIVLLADTRTILLPALANKALYHLATILAGMTWFVIVLKFLSYGRPAWKTALAGGIFTGMLFALGDILLHFVLSYKNIQTIYGASTSLVLLLLFVFYCSFIFYFGAAFTAVLAARTGKPILLTPQAVRYTLQNAE